MKLRILAPDIWLKDAVGNFCFDLAEMFKQDNSYDVALYAQNYSNEGTPEIKSMSSFFEDVTPDCIILLSYSIFDSYLEQIIALPNKKVCYFHGVTTPELLQDLEPITAQLCRKSQEQFSKLKAFDHLIANSKFIAEDLQKYIGNNKEIQVLPPVFGSRYIFNDEVVLEEVLGAQIKLLYVGRVVPHKKVEDIIEILNQLRKYNDLISLVVVGDAPNAHYLELLLEKARQFNLPENSIEFTGKVSDAELVEFYQSADLFITMSQHEGFCIPALEAISYGLPVVLKRGTAAEEVAGSFSLVIDDSSNVGEIITLLDDTKSRSLLKSTGMEYVKNYLAINNIDIWSKILLEL